MKSMLISSREAKILEFCTLARSKLMKNQSLVGIQAIYRYIKFLEFISLHTRQSHVVTDNHLEHFVMWHRHRAFKDKLAQCRIKASQEFDTMHQQSDDGAWKDQCMIEPPWL